MKLFWVFLTIFYAIIHQKHLTITAEDSIEYSTVNQKRLWNDFADQISATLKNINTLAFSLEEDDLSILQNYTNIDGDQLLHLYNIIIDGLDEIEDGLNIVHDEHELRMAVNLKQLAIDGEFILETPTDGDQEKRPFSVTLTNVRIEYVAYLIVNPYGNLVINKVVPTVSSEESQVSVRSETALSVQILKSALEHLQNTIKKRFARILTLNFLPKYHSEESVYHDVSKETLAMFELRRFVSQRYDPYTFMWVHAKDVIHSSWRVSPARIHGFSNIHLNSTGVMVTDDSVDILVEMFVDGLHGDFSYFTSEQAGYNVAFSVARIDIVVKIKLMVADNRIAATVPILDAITISMIDTECRLRDKVTDGMRENENKSVSVIEETFCQIINEYFRSSIKDTIQSEIFDWIALEDFRDSILAVFNEHA